MDPEERARLLAIAYGADADPDAAAEARRALTPPRAPAPEPAAPLEVTDSAPGRDPGAVSGTASAAPARAPARRRIAALVAATAVVAAALGVGGSMLATRLGPTVVATDRSSSGGAGTGVRIAATLAAARTGEDRLPSTMTADVDHATTHIVYETYPGQPPIRWRVWVATASAGTEICFVVSADGYASDVTCTARAEALEGTVRFVERDGGEGLSVLDDHGTVGIALVGVD